MANKKSSPVKKAAKSAVKRSVKKTAKKGVKKAFSEPNLNEKGSSPKQVKKGRSLAAKILPYLFLVFALVLVISLFIIRVIGMDDGAGIVGYGILWVLGGFFGGGAILLPLAFGYLGVKWCLHNVKWTEKEMSANYDDYRKARKKLLLQGIMTSLVVLFVSVLFATIADYNFLDLGEMWSDGAEELVVGGGIIGGLLSYGMIAAFAPVLTFVLVSLLLLLFTLLALGLTPDYIIRKIQEKSEQRAEERALAWEAQLAEEERLAEEQKKAAAAAKAAAVAATLKKKTPEPEEQDDDLIGDEIPDLLPPDESLVEPEIYIGPARDSAPAKVTAATEATASSPEIGKDYGDESTLDTSEYDNIDDILNGLGIETAAPVEEKTAPTAAPKEDISLGTLGADEIRSDLSAIIPEESEEEEEEEIASPYLFPPIDLLLKNKNKDTSDHTEEAQENAKRLLATLQSFRINIQEIQYSRGPTITRYELRPEAGVRVRSIANLVDDIALSLATSGVRIEAPIPGKPFVGIEVPNKDRATVYLRDLIENPQFTDAKSKLTASLGMDVGGNPIYFDITKMPHMIIAGATGMGKSVCINSIIISILYKARPEDVKLILIDPKKVEFNLYKDMPHLYAPIVSEPKKAAGALASAVAEMERRFELIEEVGVRDITSYNIATENDPYKEHLPHMVIIIDELADLMMTAPDEVETAICRLAQKARAAGIHIIIGTQRPSVDVITGLIKANIPSRIACTVASQVDSRTIIDIAGAEKLIGRGDMLFAPVGASKPIRVQGAFVSDGEVENVTTFVRENNAKAKYNNEFMAHLEEAAAGIGQKKSSGGDAMASADFDGGDDKFAAAVRLAVEEGKISTSLMQRRLGVGYGRAAKIIDTMEEMGYVSKPDGNKPRRVLLTADEYARRMEEGTLGGGDE
ncbi:MAG: DNA translocase FtsK [Clostridia bacterium]|nr:DNA translocase FtsK [Clostridia bacterium]